ncbi:MAG: polysaccharide deacetylase family protein [Candidatus Sabulitectum sp.]|nr:polysaccharide deacetylase family protein [Candidatus Sabulitectum sp.]
MTHSSAIPVLYFHSVAPAPDPNWYKSKLTVSTRIFEQLLKYYSSHHYSFLCLDEYAELNNAMSTNTKAICLTFDDGYLDNFVHVFPLLKRYNAKATIFVSPEYVDPAEIVRPTMEDVWNGKCLVSDLESSGFLSWAEMRLMESSGLVDIQSHTMTHTKVFRDSTIRDFHNPGADWLYPIGNLFPERKPFYITDAVFPNLLPYGTPFFTESSALVTRRVSINLSFNQECISILEGTDWRNYSFSHAMSVVKKLYNKYTENGTLVDGTESVADYQTRVRDEIIRSKAIIEEKLSKEVKHICWPHGDYNQFCIDTAFGSGYRSVHAVPGKGPVPDRSFTRIGVTELKTMKFLSSVRTVFKTEAQRGAFPFSTVANMYSKFRSLVKKR